MNTTKSRKVLLRQRVGEILKAMAILARSKNDAQRSLTTYGYPIRYPKGLEYEKRRLSQKFSKVFKRCRQIGFD